MFCPSCSFEDTKVLESRLISEGRSIRRRRSCLKCGYRFTTYEKEEELSFQIKKKDGRFESYQREKAMHSIQTACQKRSVAIDQMDAMLAAVEQRLQEEGERVVSSQRIGDLIMQALQEVDHVAYVRFASVYKEFKDPEEFMSALKMLEISKLQTRI